MNTSGGGRGTRTLEPGAGCRCHRPGGTPTPRAKTPADSGATPHIALLTLSASAAERGGVEVFNDQVRAALGNVEIIEDPPLQRGYAFADLRRIGLDQPARALRAMHALVRRHRDAPFDLVISNGVAGWPLPLARLGIPAVEVYHLTLAGLARQALTLRGDRVTTGQVTGLFDRLGGVGKEVVAVSPRVLHEVESFYGLRGRCIPPGVDASLFSPADRTAAREALGLPLDKPIGIFAGRPDYSKGYDILLQVADRCPDILFLIAGGTGPPVGNVRPIGRIPHFEMPLWYSASDFLLNPSRYEGFNLVILEALSCDRPVVASAAAFSIPEQATRCGVVVEGNEVDAFVRAIDRVLDGVPFHPREVVVPRYSIERFAESWRALLGSLLSPYADHSGTEATHAASRATLRRSRVELMGKAR